MPAFVKKVQLKYLQMVVERSRKTNLPFGRGARGPSFGGIEDTSILTSRDARLPGEYSAEVPSEGGSFA
jgi:hypothetical protein